MAVGDASDNNNIVHSSDNGETWAASTGDIFGTGEGASVTTDGKGNWVAAGSSGSGGGIVYSINNGATWTVATGTVFATRTGHSVTY